MELQLAPRDVLPHGKGMQLLGEGHVDVEGWLVYSVSLSAEMSVVDGDKTAPAELGLEIMAQACGMLLASEGYKAGDGPRRGVVGAVRGYEYDTEAFRVEDELRVRVKADLVESDLIVCMGEVYRGDSEVPVQRARITLILVEDSSL